MNENDDGRKLVAVNRADLVDRYEQYHRVVRSLHDRILSQINPAMLQEALDELGTWLDEPIALDNDTVKDVVCEFLLYATRFKGGTPIEQTLAHDPPAKGSDERLVLEAMAKPFYGLLAVEGTEPDVGVNGVELRTGAEMFVVNRLLGSTIQPGAVLAGFFLRLPEMLCAAGALLPLPKVLALEMSLGPPEPPAGDRLRMILADARKWAADQLERAYVEEMAEAMSSMSLENDEAARKTKPLSRSKAKREIELKRRRHPGLIESEVASWVIAEALQAGAAEGIEYR